MKIYNFNRETDEGARKFYDLMQPDSWLFKLVEKEFNDYMEANGDRDELSEKYFSEDAIYDKVGAIRGGIEQIFEVLDEYNLPFIFLTDKRLDLTSAFAD